jgi:hypothetical protein
MKNITKVGSVLLISSFMGSAFASAPDHFSGNYIAGEGCNSFGLGLIGDKVIVNENVPGGDGVSSIPRDYLMIEFTAVVPYAELSPLLRPYSNGQPMNQVAMDLSIGEVSESGFSNSSEQQTGVFSSDGSSFTYQNFEGTVLRYAVTIKANSTGLLVTSKDLDTNSSVACQLKK